jgi:hypothetical protein
MIVPQGKRQFHGERSKFFKETYVPKKLQSKPSHVCYYISLQPIIEKDLEESYNFVVGSISIKFYMKFFKSNKFSNTFVPQGT